MSPPSAAQFLPPQALRNGHLQTILSSSGVRRRLLSRAARRLAEGAEQVLVSGGSGVRLSGAYTAQSERTEARGLAVLFHGWEGSVDSTYVLQTGSALLAEGWDVFRLNFRDHGASHTLNEALFHSCRIDEVLQALADITARWPHRTTVLAGFSLGGNFALRAGLLAPQRGVPLDHVLAVCPIIDPAEGLFALEKHAPWLYHAYFMRKWRRSLRAKQAAFPQQQFFEVAELKRNMRELTEALVLRHTDFGSLEAYLDGYSVAGNALQAMQVPTSILTARDDPVIPVQAFEKLQLPPTVQLEIARYGGHCGFIQGWDMTSFTDRYITERCNAAAESD